MHSRLVWLFLVGVTSILTNSGCTPAQHIDYKSLQQQEPPFIIAVVGDGVPDSGEPDPTDEVTIPPNASQGLAMYAGAKAAYDNASGFQKGRHVAKLESYNDYGNLKTAKSIANRLALNDRVLAVIGHGLSSTTQEAAIIYHQAQIPLIMPIATSPTVIQGTRRISDPPLNNCFRLPLDDKYQSASIERLVGDLKKSRCLLLRDATPPANAYSQFLYDELLRRLGKKIVERRDISTTSAQLDSFVQMHAYDLIIFCGYSEQANHLLHVLSKTFQQKNEPKNPCPPIILTDGCRFGNLDTRGLEVYLTFPVPPIADPPLNQLDFNLLKKTIVLPEDETYQMYGYDSILILGHAIDQCKSRLSRSEILKVIANQKLIHGVSTSYSFSTNLNVLSKYYVFKVSMQNSRPQFVLDRSFAVTDLDAKRP